MIAILLADILSPSCGYCRKQICEKILYVCMRIQNKDYSILSNKVTFGDELAIFLFFSPKHSST